MQNNQTTENFTPFRGLPWFNLIAKSEVTIGGAGGIGSWLTLFLERAGLRVQLFDFDIVEERNLGGQLYSKRSVGDFKTSAMQKLIINLVCNSNLAVYTRVLDSNTTVSGFCFSAFDNMQARKDMFHAWKRKLSEIPEDKRYTCIFIDGRLEAEFFQIYCVTASRIAQYEETLFADSEIADVACTVKQTSHVAAMIGAFMTSFFTNHITNIAENMKVREVPFKFEMFLPILKITES